MSTDYSQFFYKAKSRLSTDALTPDNNELLVDLSRSRGEYKQQKLLAILDLIGTSGLSDEALPGYHYMLLGGHIGSGKSTELRVLQKQLTRHDRYFTVFIDIVEEIDFNNLSYSDLFITIGKRLVDEIGTANITLDQDFVTPLTSWAQEVVNTKNDSKILSSELKAGAKGKLGLPFVGALFSHFATSIRSNATYKSEVREVIVNNFTHLASALNQLLRHAEKQMQHENIARKILFIIDGTDRLTPEDAENFFSDGVMQLRQLKASFIYCTRNRFLDEDSRLAQLFSLVSDPHDKTERQEW